jgi:hypothetical protein
VSTLVPGPAEQLLHTCAHGLRPFPASLRWIADAAVIISSAGERIDWNRLIEGAARRQLALRTATALSVLVDLLGTPVPRQAMAELEALPPGPRERLILGLALQPVPLRGYVLLWDVYRRRATAEDHGPTPHDFLQYVADVEELPSRRAIAPMLLRHYSRRVRQLVRGKRLSRVVHP